MTERFFIFLHKSNIDFCIINGYKEIVAKVDTDSDRDILFKQNDFKNIEKIITDFSKKENLLIVQKMHHDILAKNFFLFNPKNGDFLNLDLYGELSRKGIVYFQENEIFNTLKNYENIPILSNEKEFISYLTKKLDKNDLSIENFKHLSELYFDSQQLCDDVLKSFFPNYHQLIKQYFIKNDFVGIKKDEKKIIKDFYKLKNNNIFRKLSNSFRLTKRIIKPTGLTIAFIGPDSVEKSILIDTILKKQLPFRRKDFFPLQPTITIDNFQLNETYFNLKLLYLIYQYNMDWIKNILKLKIKSSLVVFDKYFDDLLVHFRCSGYERRLKTTKIVRYFIPKPDLYFILTTDTDIIYKRKQEISDKELERQIDNYRALADGKHYFNIDINKTPEQISQEIMQIMMEKMNKRY